MKDITPPTKNISSSPDKSTRLGLSDLTGDKADGRILYINLWFFKYGTNDRSHAAAIAISLILLLMICVVIALGTFEKIDSSWIENVFDWLGGTFLFVAGIALGGRGEDSKD